MSKIIIPLFIAVVVNCLPLPFVTKCIIMVVMGCVFGALVSLIENIIAQRKHKDAVKKGGADDCSN